LWGTVQQDFVGLAARLADAMQRQMQGDSASRDTSDRFEVECTGQVRDADEEMRAPQVSPDDAKALARKRIFDVDLDRRAILLKERPFKPPPAKKWDVFLEIVSWIARDYQLNGYGVAADAVRKYIHLQLPGSKPEPGEKETTPPDFNHIG